jgi:hypothetical protein
MAARLLFAAAVVAYKAGEVSESAVTRSILLAPAVVALLASNPAAAEHWTFCVASALGGKDIWITDVFAAGADRERLEAEMKGFLEGRGEARVVAQCPQPRDDKTDVVNAQIVAEEFNRKLGAALHAVTAQEFPRR